MRKLTIVAATLLCLVAWILPGCNQTPEERQKTLTLLSEKEGQVKAAIAATTQKLPELEAAVAALPEGEARNKAVKLLADARENLPKAQRVLEQLDVAAKALQGGDVGGAVLALGGTLAGVPGAGQYAALATLLGGLALSVFQAFKQKSAATAAAADADEQAQHLENVVTSIAAAGIEFTDAQKEAIKTVQGPATSLVVEQIKSGVGG